jgi:hypothetical protein
MEARRGRLRRTAAAALFALAAAGAPVRAHDSWLVPEGEAASPSRTLLALSTGTRYPVQEFNPTRDSLVTSECVDAAGAVTPLVPLKDAPNRLTLEAKARALSCRIEMKAYDIVLQPPLVDVYIAEIRPPQPQREAWAAMQAAGHPWREQYRKFMRIELPAQDAATPQQRAAARAPRGLGLELVVLGDAPLAVNQPLQFQLLRDGQPLPGLAVEFVSERSKLGIWRSTDAEGKLTQALPFTGRWLLRAVDLGLPTGEPPAWHSRFVTLSIELR